MKRNILIFSLAIILASCTGFIKNNAQENAGWIVSLDEAVALSEKTGKPIMANFTGSDWCGWCKRLKAEVFDTPEFKDWASDNVILLELDFPRRTAISDELKKEGIARELVNRIQNVRKDSGFEVTDQIDVTLQKDGTVEDAVQQNIEYIKTETLTANLDLAEEVNNGQDIEFDEVTTQLFIKKH